MNGQENLQNIPGIGPSHRPKPGLSRPERIDMNPAHDHSQLQKNNGFGRSISHSGDKPIPYHERYLAQDLPTPRIRKSQSLIDMV